MSKPLILDGAMGTMLQAAGLRPGEHPEVFGCQHPDVITEIEKKYLAAGSDVIYTNTFGANSKKLQGCGITVDEAVKCALASAEKAVTEHEAATTGQPTPDFSIFKGLKERLSEKGRHHAIALDVGPIGELLEPLGTVTFEDAYAAYAEEIEAGARYGADLIVIETFTDLSDARAAVLAAKEHSDLPVAVTMTFEESGRTFTGTTIASFAMAMEGLGADAVGINCSLGPEEIRPLIEEMEDWTSLPIIVKPNAGLPDPKTGEYRLKAADFAAQMNKYSDLSIALAGGCCGTDPEYIRLLSDTAAKWADPGKRPDRRKRGVCSPSNVCEFGGVRVIGERLNPTGKKKFQQALLEHDMGYICKVALQEEEAGADILDVNVGVPGGDEKELMVEVLRALLGVISLPLQFDSRDPETIEAALRLYPGRAIVNSINADDATLDRMLPVIKKYGAASIVLCLDEDGIPTDAKGRIEKAEHVINRCAQEGIGPEDLLMDCLTLTVSAQQDQARETLKALRYITEHYHTHASLGVSNISFGLPARKHITESFLVQAMACGLDFPIINPNQLEMMDAVASFKVLSGEDANCASYIERFADRVEEKTVEKKKSATSGGAGSTSVSTGDMTIEHAVLKGLKDETRALAEKALLTMSEEEVINGELIPALDVVGEQYEKGILFLPQLISSANAATAAFDMIKERISARNSGSGNISRGTIVICTVKGDIHDIGKNIVKVVLENYGYHMIDLGKDVPVEKVVDAVKNSGAGLLGLSALMTTTLPAMKETIEAVKAASPDTKVMVGGAVVTPEYAAEIGADFYCGDARDSVKAAQEVLG